MNTDEDDRKYLEEYEFRCELCNEKKASVLDVQTNQGKKDLCSDCTDKIIEERNKLYC
jgi:predicted SprT family Zn-dependent metalloprotease